MIPKQTLTPYPEFGDSSTKVKPDDPKYSEGFIPTDVLPAEWLNWFLNRSSKGVTELGAGVESMEAEIINVLTAGNQTPDAEETSQLLAAIIEIIAQTTLVSEQLPAVGVPTLWMGPKPDWALDFGNGADTQYLWANYPKLNNDKFKGILSTLSTAGWMTAHDDSGFYVPDLRGVVPIGYGTNAVRTTETLSGGSTPGTYAGSQNAYHRHGKGDYRIQGYVSTFRYATAAAPGATGAGALAWQIESSTYAQASTESPNANGRTLRIDTDLNSGAGWTGNSGYAGSNKQASKPATIGCMWIVRFN